MYPEVEQFIAAMKAADEEENRAHEAAWTVYTEKAEAANLGPHTSQSCARCAFESEGPAAQERRAAHTAHADAWENAVLAAWDALKGSGDPLVAWIAANCQEYPNEAQKVLRLLPAPLETLDALAAEAGWCGAWDWFREAAEEAGVLLAPAAAAAESEVTA